jgi:precorrin isomerase
MTTANAHTAIAKIDQRAGEHEDQQRHQHVRQRTNHASADAHEHTEQVAVEFLTPNASVGELIQDEARPAVGGDQEHERPHHAHEPARHCK